MLSHTHMHTAEDREGLAVLSHTCTQARTWKDRLCCLTHTCTHGGGCCAVCDETLHSHMRLGNRDTWFPLSRHFLVLNKLRTCSKTALSTQLSF